MSILIKGLKAPKTCGRCVFCYKSYWFDKCTLTEYLVSVNSRPDWCPITELPEKHGRLIDAEKLKNEYPHDTDWDYPVNTNCYVCESIENAPSVIEAEGEEPYRTRYEVGEEHPVAYEIEAEGE